jgi:hypothetical protein
MGFNNYGITKMGLEGAGILYTILSVLEMILLEVLGSEGKGNLVRGGSSSSSSNDSGGNR